MRTVKFTKAERERLADQCKALGITFEEFVRHATMQALDEMEGRPHATFIAYPDFTPELAAAAIARANETGEPQVVWYGA